jgi:hypothetical protein
MTYAIVGIQSNKVAKDDEGNLHYYESEARADEICAEMNKKAALSRGVDINFGYKDVFKVSPR